MTPWFEVQALHDECPHPGPSYICGDKILLFFLKPLMGITKLEMIAITITEMFFVKIKRKSRNMGL